MVSPYLERIPTLPDKMPQVRTFNTAFTMMPPLMEGMASPNVNQVAQNNTVLSGQIRNYRLLDKQVSDTNPTHIAMRDKMDMDIQDFIKHENTTFFLGGAALVVLLIATAMVVVKNRNEL